MIQWRKKLKNVFNFGFIAKSNKTIDAITNKLVIGPRPLLLGYKFKWWFMNEVSAVSEVS